MKQLFLLCTLLTLLFSGPVMRAADPAGPAMRVKDIASGPMPTEHRRVISNPIREAIAIDNLLFFARHTDTYGTELWRSDGTQAGTQLIKDIAPGRGWSMAYQYLLITHNGLLYFAANDGSSGTEPWRTDGTADGTFMKEMVQAAPDDSSHPYAI